jgi:hypothetical protein
VAIRDALAAAGRQHRVAGRAKPDVVDAGAAVGPAEHRLRLQSYDQVWAAMDGGIGDVVRDALGRAGIAPMKKIRDNGFRQITSSSSRQLNGIEDLKGFKIRVPVTALLTSLFSGLRALPSSIS